MEEKTKTKKKKHPVLIIVIIACLCVIAYAAYNIISISMNYKAAQDEYSKIRTEAVTETDLDKPTEEKVKEAEEDEDEEEIKIPAPIEIDHKALLAGNSDYVGWIYIEALGISYPVMQSTDNDFYLHRTYEKESLFAGSIFIDYENNRDMSDPNTIVYGHNMKDDSMFGNLNLLYDSELYKNSSYFWILTPDENCLYQIFSMQYCEDDSDIYTLFSGPGSIVKDYITKMRSQSVVDFGDIEYDEDSKVVTLSTCVSAEGSARFVVQGIRIQ